jgi:hypothetical protein
LVPRYAKHAALASLIASAKFDDLLTTKQAAKLLVKKKARGTLVIVREDGLMSQPEGQVCHLQVDQP